MISTWLCGERGARDPARGEADEPHIKALGWPVLDVNAKIEKRDRMKPVLGSKRASPKRSEVAMPTDRSMTAQDVANYFIDLVDAPSGDNITNLKLQKLLYYAQGFYIAMQGEPLFPESLLAWKHGPVVRRIYDEYRGYAWEPLPAPRGIDRSQYVPEVREILDTVQDQYGRYTAKTLEKMTHEESPWLETPTNKIISLELLHEFFSQITTAGRKKAARSRTILFGRRIPFDFRREGNSQKEWNCIVRD